VRVLPNGVEPEALSVTGPRGPDVLFLGRLEIAQKGLDVLLEAWSTVHGKMPGRLLLAGDGPDAGELERLVVRRGVQESVAFIGRVDPDERLALLRSARVTVMPSRFETFGLVALESLAVGTPVVATDIDCLRDVVAPGPGVLVPVDDVGALAAAMLEVALDEGWASRHEATARSWAAGFTWDSVAREQGEVLRSAL
jgi:glycosyltransferase involved in cell wall biosynthesis